ncbi:MAG: hypothetical protein OEY75_12995 [Hylemonella sp.]|nr:hypothetical protein [Hylemonella sp.]MDH5710019.1 hypothetical protein [Hylemonella sp.]
MRLPIFQKKVRDHLVLSWTPGQLAYVQARSQRGGKSVIERFGVERQGVDTDEDFAKRLANLNFKGSQATAVLLPEQYQIFQIDTPSVAPDELRTAARWQIRDMVDTHLDDLTLDVLRVGDESVRGSGSLFVVTAANAAIQEVLNIGETLGCTIDVIDVQDMAQRNIQSALARANGKLDRAQAAIVLVDERQALLTISANEELFYTRRIDMGTDFGRPGGAPNPFALAPQGEKSNEFSYEMADDGQTSVEDDRMQRFLVEIQRSLDLWGRSWPMMALDSVSVYDGPRSAELAQWLEQGIGVAVAPLDVGRLFDGLETDAQADLGVCWPLLGALLRSETHKL